ncbi:MAG: butyrate kinase [Proteobacteria bacterium]|nr:butyrate kinase [Pseudomonadota bacterium]
MGVIEMNILVINVGSTSTKVALFKEMDVVAEETIVYSSAELAQYKDMKDQLPRREEDILRFINDNNINMEEIDIIISRGGVGKPEPAGAYEINEIMCNDLITGKYGKHPSALGPAMALDMSKRYGIRAIVMDPPSTDEFQPLARISGLPGLERKSAFHALNQKAAARRASGEIGKSYEDVNLVVAHLGGGITIGAHRGGKVIDCTHGLSEGPFTPERAGSLPTADLVDLAFSGKYSKEQMQRKLVGQGGLFAYLATADAVEVEKMISGGDEKAKLVYQAMAYQIAKDIGAMSVVLKGRVDGVVLTGGLAHSEMLTGWIVERTDFIAPIFIYPGEDEMTAMAQGALRVLEGKEQVKKYQ